MTNWIDDPNPFGLVAPPRWWLKQLQKFDADLVLIAGLRDPMYRLTRKSPLAGYWNATFRDGEMARMITLGVVPVRSLPATFVFNQDLFTWLRARDTWSFGGGTKEDSIDRAIASVEAREAAEADALQRQTDSDLDAIGSSAHFSLTMRRGNAVFVRGYRGPVSTDESHRSSDAHVGPVLGDLAHGSLPRECSEGEAARAGHHAARQDPVDRPGALQLSGAAEGQP